MIHILESYIKDHWPAFLSRQVSSSYYDLRQLFIVTTGLSGETGELVEHFKKHVRDGTPIDRKKVRLEFGDVLHYLTRLANMYDFDMREIIEANMDKLDKRRAERGSTDKMGHEEVR